MIGQIIREYGQTLEVETERTVYSCFSRKNLQSIVTGDFVKFNWDPSTKQGIITERLARKNVLCRRDRYHPVKEMVANIDQIIVMFAPCPRPHEFYLDQYLIAAELIKLPVLMLLNKADLAEVSDPDIQNLKALYENIGYPVLPISTKMQTGIDALTRALAGKVSFILGASGVGKSSLINVLVGESTARVQAVSAANQKGQHTTSTSKLYHLQNKAAIIDVPGLRELQLPLAQHAFIAQGFKEWQRYLGHCRFRNCAHRHDPGCVIVEGVNAGKLNPGRLKNYYRMIATD